MRRHLILAVVIVLGLAIASGESQSPARAQEGTPVTEVTFEGATIEAGAFGPVPAFPPEPAEIGVLRLRFEPGGRLLVPANDPGMAIHFLDSGTMTIRFSAPVVVVRGEAQTQEQVPANTPFTLAAGDAFVAPSPSGGEFRNDGAEDAILLIAVTAPVETATPEP
jgi:hypothetical protein